ncbi:MAG: hypothetical protein QOJ90_2787 [Actinomycetota bacterium]|jgi:undecaprenyl-diphosphatase|nr:hypothetical protein [Actinomycetota bacterium]
MTSAVAKIAARILLSLAVLYGLLVGLGLILTKVIQHSGLIHDEDQLNKTLADGRTSPMNHITYWLSGLGNTGAIVGAMLVVAIGLRLASRSWIPSVFLVVAVASQSIVFLLTTLVIKRRRPNVPHLDKSPPTSSFPSGHTGASTALFLGSALLVLWYVKRRWVKIIGVTLLVAVPLLVGYGRLYRGMHHPTDVAAAYLNGTTCIAIAAVNILRRDRSRTTPALASAGPH